MSWWNAKYKNDHDEYEITFGSKYKEKTKIVEKVCKWIIDNLVQSEDDMAIVRHGRWKECDWVEYDGHSECVRYPKKGRVCTNCRNAFNKEFIDDPRVHYCPHCGVKMDGDDHGNVEM